MKYRMWRTCDNNFDRLLEVDEYSCNLFITNDENIHILFAACAGKISRRINNKDILKKYKWVPVVIDKDNPNSTDLLTESDGNPDVYVGEVSEDDFFLMSI